MQRAVKLGTSFVAARRRLGVSLGVLGRSAVSLGVLGRSAVSLGALLAALLTAGALAPAPALATASLSWSSPSSIDFGQTLQGISCPSREECVAVDAVGRVLASTSPASGGPWRQVASLPHALTAVSCASTALCVAVDDAGDAIVSADPTSASSWTARSIDGTTALSALACPSESLCVAVDQAGRALSSVEPAKARSWRLASIDTGHVLQSVGCSSVALCVAVDDAGAAISSGEPSGPASAWRRREIDRPLPLTGVSCVAGGGCVAVDGQGDALASADPAGPTPTWSSTGIDTRPLSGVSCASSGLCVAVDGGEGPVGEALASDDPIGALPLWSASRADPGVALGGISCDGEGFCAAIAEGGHVLAGSVPAPQVSTGAPDEVAPNAATLAGSVDPNDALLAECSFEYGTTTSYGQSALCAPLPAPAGATQTVSAAIGGLAPATTYHYRLVARSGAGEGTGADQTFTTASSALVRPHPSISGVPAVGDRLLCDSGVPPGSGATLSYAWRRDDAPIAGANGSSYRVVRADATHHLQCLVTATDAAGSVTEHSAFVTVPAQGVLAAAQETSVGRARVSGGAVSVAIRCSPRAAGACAIVLRITVVGSVEHRRTTFTVGSLGARLRPAQRRVLSVSLDSLGRRMLARSKRLSARLWVSGTVIGALRASLSVQRVTLSLPTHGRRR